jgi:hypothetical protein
VTLGPLQNTLQHQPEILRANQRVDPFQSMLFKVASIEEATSILKSMKMRKKKRLICF